MRWFPQGTSDSCGWGHVLSRKPVGPQFGWGDLRQGPACRKTPPRLSAGTVAILAGSRDTGHREAFGTGSTGIEGPSQAASLPSNRDESHRFGHGRRTQAGQPGGKRRFRQPRRRCLCELHSSYGPFIDCWKTEPVRRTRGATLPGCRRHVLTQPDPVIVDALARYRHLIEGGRQCGVGPVPCPCPPAGQTVGIPDDERASRMYSFQEMPTRFTQGPDRLLCESDGRICPQQHFAYRPRHFERCTGAEPGTAPLRFSAPVHGFHEAALAQPVDVRDHPAPAAEQQTARPVHALGEQAGVGPTDLRPAVQHGELRGRGEDCREVHELAVPETPFGCRVDE